MLLSRKSLVFRSWLDANADARTVLVHISNLRAKLRGGREEGNIQIQREGSRGYRLTLEAEKEWE